MAKSIKNKLAILILVCLVLPLFIFRFAAYPSIEHKTEEYLEQRLIEISKKQVELMNTWIDEKKKQAIVIASDYQIVSLIHAPLSKDNKDYTTLLEHIEFIRDEHGFKGIFIADTEGIIRLTTEPEMEYIDISGTQYGSKGLAGETYISNIFPSAFPILNEYGQKERKTPTLFVSTPIRDKSYRIIGILGLRIDVGELNILLHGLNFSESGDTYLVDLEGIMLTNSRFTSSAKEFGLINQRTALELRVTDRKSGGLTKAVKRCIEGKNGIDTMGYLNYLGKEVVGVWNWQDKYKWGIVSEIDKKEAYHLASGIKNDLVKMLFYCGIVFIFISIYLGRKLCKSIVQLSTFAKTVSTGKGYKDLIKITSNDEIGELADSFNTMVLSVREKDLITNFNEIIASNLLPDVFEAIGNELRRMMNFDRLSISCLHTSFGEDKLFDTFVMTDGRPDKEVSKLCIGAISKLEGSLTERIFATGKPVIVEDTQKGRLWSDTLLFKEGIRSRMGYPLTYKNEVIGSLNFGSRLPNNFSAKQFFLLEKIAPVLAVALKNTKLFEAERQREFINRINKIIASSLSPDVFEAISKELKAFIDFDRISITCEYEADKKKGCKIFAMTGELIPIESSKLKKGTISDLEGSLFGKVLKEGRPVIVPDTEKGELWSDKDLLKEGIRSRMSYPLTYKGKIIASINFGSKKHNNFSEKDINIISELGPQLAVAVENARLLEKMNLTNISLT